MHQVAAFYTDADTMHTYQGFGLSFGPTWKGELCSSKLKSINKNEDAYCSK